MFFQTDDESKAIPGPRGRPDAQHQANAVRRPLDVQLLQRGIEISP